MIIEDFTMLGRTEPTESKKYGPCVCSAGYSREMRQFIRIYPLPISNQIPKWQRCVIPVRRPRDDSRDESWRINVPDDSADRAASAVTKIDSAKKDAEFDWLRSMAATSISDLNKRRASLAIIDPKSMRWGFDRRSDVDPADQLTLFDRMEYDGAVHRSDLVPKVTFEDAAGFHTLSLKEWGCAEWLRKRRLDCHQLWSNLRFDDAMYEHLLFVGNQNNHRNSWLIISTVSRRKTSQLSLLEAA
jgi:hypothetical protein